MNEELDGTTPFIATSMLHELFNLQYNLTNRYTVLYEGEPLADVIHYPFVRNCEDDLGYRERLITDTCSLIAEEAFEFKRNFNYKNWKTYKKVNEESAKEELIDIWHFLLQATLLMGFTPESLLAEFRKKNEINHNRQDSGIY